MKLRSKITWILLSAIVIAAVGYWQMRKNSATAQAVATAPAATNDTPASELLTSNVTTLELQTLRHTLPVSGNLKALNTVTIKARVSGELLMLNGREGDSVKAGQTIAKIDPAEFQRKLRQAEQQADAAKSQIDIAQRQFDNNKALVDQGFISKTALEASEATLLGAKATFNAASAGDGDHHAAGNSPCCVRLAARVDGGDV